MRVARCGVRAGDAGVAGVAASGATAASLAAVSAACCTGPVLAPLVVAVLGAGGAAWAAGLKPYTPYLFTASGMLLAFGFRTVYGPRPTTCAADPSTTTIRRPGTGSSRFIRTAVIATLWLAAAIWTGSVALAIYAAFFDNPYV